VGKQIEISMPDKEFDGNCLNDEVKAVDPTAKAYVLASRQRIRIHCADEFDASSFQSVIDAHDCAGHILEQAIQIKMFEIDAKADEVVHERIDYDGSNFAADFESQFRIKSKLMDAIRYNETKPAEDPEFSIVWIARPAPVVLTEQKFSELSYLIEARISNAVFNANTHKQAVAALTLVDEISSYDFSSGW